jgi:hypothetical protein
MIVGNLVKRLANKVELTTDGHRVYLEAVEGTFCGSVDYPQRQNLTMRTPICRFTQVSNGCSNKLGNHITRWPSTSSTTLLPDA